jgi:hypothetical protein
MPLCRTRGKLYSFLSIFSFFRVPLIDNMMTMHLISVLLFSCLSFSSTKTSRNLKILVLAFSLILLKAVQNRHEEQYTSRRTPLLLCSHISSSYLCPPRISTEIYPDVFAFTISPLMLPLSLNSCASPLAVPCYCKTVFRPLCNVHVLRAPDTKTR